MDAPDKTPVVPTKQEIENEIKISLEAMAYIAAHCQLGPMLALVHWTTLYVKSLVRWGVLTQDEADELVISFSTNNQGAPVGHIINGL
jgi:hypothetical protein